MCECMCEGMSEYVHLCMRNHVCSIAVHTYIDSDLGGQLCRSLSFWRLWCWRALQQVEEAASTTREEKVYVLLLVRWSCEYMWNDVSWQALLAHACTRTRTCTHMQSHIQHTYLCTCLCTHIPCLSTSTHNIRPTRSQVWGFWLSLGSGQLSNYMHLPMYVCIPIPLRPTVLQYMQHNTDLQFHSSSPPRYCPPRLEPRQLSVWQGNCKCVGDHCL